MFRLGAGLILACLSWSAKGMAVSAQPVGRLEGTVTDAATGEVLPRANIRVLDTSRGTITNADGRYLLVLEPGAYRITFGVIGYRPDTLQVVLRGGDRQTRDVAMVRAPIELPPITVRPGITDMAQELVRRAIAARLAMLESLRSLHFQAYTRTDILYVDPDSVAAGEQIGGIMEAQTEGFWRAPDDYVERILARRQTATYTPQQNVFASGRLPSFNQEKIEVGTTRVLSPLAASALNHYSYTILDTVAAGGRRAYRIAVEPNSRLIPLFRGTMVIADGSWLLLDVDLEGNEATERPPLVEWRLRQQFALYGDRWWLPIDSWIRFRLDIGFDFLLMYLEMHSVRYDYFINEPLPEGVFGRYQVVVEPTADAVDSTSWEGHQILPLTGREQEAYRNIQREWDEASPTMRRLLRILGGGESPATTTARPFPELRYNRVEGLRLGAGMRLEERITGSELEVRGGFGFADQDWKYRLEARRWIIRQPEITLGVGYERAMTYREGMQVYSPAGITMQTLLYGVDPVDYYRSQGSDIWLRLQPIGDLRLEFRYRDQQHTSVGRNVRASPFHRSTPFRDNPPVIEGRLRSGMLSAELDTRRLVRFAGEDMPVEGRGYFLLRGDFEVSDPSAWGSDFSFVRGAGLAEFRLFTAGAAYLDAIAIVGNAWGDLPPQRLYDLHGSKGGEYRRGAFMTLRPGQYVGDRMGLLWLEHNFSSIPLRLLGVEPGSDLDLDIIVHGTVGWCGLRSSNIDLVAYGARAVDEVHSEIGLGLGRVMSFMRLDLTWRLAPRAERNLVFSVGASF